ncbi:hypothetical protein RBB78_19075 [Tunturiibacter empetritectus]
MASAHALSSASETEGFSGRPAVGISGAGAVGGRACSAVTGFSEDGAMELFSNHSPAAAGADCDYLLMLTRLPVLIG